MNTENRNREHKEQSNLIDICETATILVQKELNYQYSKVMIANIVNNNHNYFLKNNLKYSLSSPESNIEFLKRKVLRRIECLEGKQKQRKEEEDIDFRSLICHGFEEEYSPEHSRMIKVSKCKACERTFGGSGAFWGLCGTCILLRAEELKLYKRLSGRTEV